MTDPSFQVITPPPQPRYTVYASLLETGDVLQAGDLIDAGQSRGWVPVDPTLYGLSLSEPVGAAVIRPPVR